MGAPDRVLFIVENLPLPFDRRVWREATALRDAGSSVSAICPVRSGYEARHQVLDGIRIHRHPLPPEESTVPGYFREYSTALKWEWRLAHRVWKEDGFDAIHICNPPDLLFLVAGWFKRRHGVRVVFDHHDLSPELYEAKYGRRDLFYHGLRWAERMTFATADVVISTNESYRRVALERGGKDPEDVFVVRSGPDLSRFRPVDPVRDYRNGRDHLVGYVGVMGEQEGIDHLLRAARHIVDELGRRDIHFMLIGSGPQAGRLRSLSRELQIGKFVEFTGRVSDEELLRRLSSCDLCVNPDPKTPFNDRSTMNKILEYMALEKPVVQFDLLEGRRSAGAASVYARPNDEADFARKIVELLDDPERRERMGREGRRRMEEAFGWRHQVPKLMAAYERLGEG